MMAIEEYFLFLGAGDDCHDEQFLPLCEGKGSSPDSSQASTGYLQDAIGGKRRRLSPPPPQPPQPPPQPYSDELQDLIQGFWESSGCGDPTMNHLGDSNVTFQDVDEKSHTFSSVKEEDDLLHQPKPEYYCEKKKKKKNAEEKETRVVAYPFAVVKPPDGDDGGGVRLDDINARLLMRPRRPVRHPVGEYAPGGRRRVSAAGPGLSGRAVVSLTRIQTQGRRGTITIIRTK